MIIKELNTRTAELKTPATSTEAALRHLSLLVIGVILPRSGFCHSVKLRMQPALQQ